jgi:hypothetical protein
MKVARHEMPGKRHRRNRPGGYGVIWVMMPFDAIPKPTQQPIDHTVPYGTDLVSERPGIACLATIIPSLRDSERLRRETKKPFSDFS